MEAREEARALDVAGDQASPVRKNRNGADFVGRFLEALGDPQTAALFFGNGELKPAEA